ncbi:MAG: T9SS type A sorting domain-containing protein [Bacteroidia bacterium]|nr:T9SS type A sorting domain-containing protein [Bacteroidia bacterium]
MKKIYNLFFALLTLAVVMPSTMSAQGCISPNTYGSGTISACGSQTINTCTFAGEFNPIQFNINGVFVLSSTGGIGNYITFTDGSNTVLAFGNSPLTVTVSIPGAYRLHVADSPTCGVESACRTTVVTCTGSIAGSPTITAQPNSTVICGNGSTSFAMAATGATSYTWMVNNGTGFVNVTNGGVYSGANTPTLTLTNVPGTYNNYVYQCVATNSIGGTVTSQATLAVNNTNVLVTGNTQLCLGSGGTLNASGAATYTWNTGSNSSSIAINPSVTTTYTVTGTSSISCISSPVIVTVQVVPNPTISSPGATVCSYPGTTSLTANASVPNITWYATPTSTTALGTGSVFATPVLTTSTVFYAQANSVFSGSLQTTMIAGNGQSGNMFDITALNNIEVNGFDMHLSATGVSTIEVWYRPGTFVGFESSNVGWTQALTTTVTSAGPGMLTNIPGSFTVNVPAGQTYAFYVTTNGGPGVSYTNGTAVGNVYASNADLQFKEGNGGGYFAVTFTPRVFNGVIRYGKPGCSSPRIPVTVGLVSSPTVAATGFSICAGQTNSVIATGATTYSWNTGATTQAISVTPSVTTTYTVTGTTGACSNMATATVTVNTCTGLNEIASDFDFKLFPNPANHFVTVVLTELYSDTYFELYDLNGKLILKEILSNNQTTISTKEIASGAYLFKVTNTNGTIKQGKLVKE